MKIIAILLLISLALIFLSVEPFSSNTSTPAKSDSLVTISIAAVGDLMCHSVQFNYARIENDSFDFTPVYRYVKEEISDADFAFGNLETVTAGKKAGLSGYPFFNSPDEYLTALKDTGFDLLTTANNHSLDRGESGVLRTIEQISFKGMGYNGTYKNQRDRDSVRIFNINGISVAFLAYTYGTNGNPIPKGKPFLINLIDTSIIRHDIKITRSKNPDLIIVHFHFGEEYKKVPSKYQKKIAEITANYGADIIIGGHPHVIQPAEYIKDRGNLDSVFIAYSLGNFISNQRWRYSDAGVILKLNITKNMKTGKVALDSIRITPTWVFKGKTRLKEKEFVILPDDFPTDSNFVSLSPSEITKMKEAFQDTRNILSSIK